MGALRIERESDFLHVTLSRPEARNAFDAALIGQLAEAFVDVGRARAVVLRGEGPSFCAGADNQRNAASQAPAAPSAWPIIALVELHGVAVPNSAATALASIESLSGVPVPCRLM